MDFPIQDLMSETACYAKLVSLLHPGGLRCPRCGAAERIGVHRYRRESVPDHRCDGCRRVFDAFTGTKLHGTRRRPSAVLLILRGVVAGDADGPVGPGTREQPDDAGAVPPADSDVGGGGVAGGGVGRSGDRGGRDVSERGGKKAFRTAIPQTRRGRGRTSERATAPGTTTDRRWPGWSAGTPGRSGCGS